MIIKNKARNLLISISFFIIVFLNFIAQTVFVEKYYWLNVVKNYGLISISVLLLIIFILSKHTRKSLIASLLIILLAIVVSYYSANPYAIMPWILMVVNVDATNYKHLIKLWVIEIGILMLIVAVSYSLGWLDESRKILVRSDGATRYSLGYVYTTFSANYFFHFTIFYIYIRTMAIRYSELLVLLIINYYVYDLTDTKAAFVVSVLSILLVVILKIYNIRVAENVYRVVNKYVLIICTFIPIILTYLYGMGYGVLDELNRVLTSRLQLGWNAINIYNINLFGQKIEPNITDIDVSTLDEIIEVKTSFSAVKENQFDKDDLGKDTPIEVYAFSKGKNKKLVGKLIVLQNNEDRKEIHIYSPTDMGCDSYLLALIGSLQCIL